MIALSCDGTFTLQEDGAIITGTYRVEGAELALATQDGRQLRMRLEATGLLDDIGGRWTKE